MQAMEAPAKTSLEPQGRLTAIRRILETGAASTQDELREQLKILGFELTQSTISRSLKKLGAIKAVDESGRTVYRLQDATDLPRPVQATLGDLVTEINSNGMLIVVRTTPGSASLVARHLDHHRPGGILGTIAGDDTIFIAPPGPRVDEGLLAAIRNHLTGG